VKVLQDLVLLNVSFVAPGNMAPGDNKPELGGPPTTKYVPPSLRGEGATRQGESMNRSGRG